jgi:chorismate mutase
MSNRSKRPLRSMTAELAAQVAKVKNAASPEAHARETAILSQLIRRAESLKAAAEREAGL